MTNSPPLSVDWKAHCGERRGTILCAAHRMFMHYGFNRVTMDDIAREAGISRPALYRDFRNKADIFAAIAAALLDGAAQAAEDMLESEDTLDVRLRRAIGAGILDLMTEIAQSPHGGEILELKKDLTAETFAGWRNRMTAALGKAIAGEARARGIDLAARGTSAEALATMLLDAVDGMKARTGDPAQWREGTARLVALALIALQ